VQQQQKLGLQSTEVQGNNVSVTCPYQQQPATREKQPVASQTTIELDDLQSYSNWSFDATTSSLDPSLPSTIYSAVHLADNLSELEDNSFDLKMAQDQVSDCQSCCEKDAEIRRLREKVDELQYIGKPSDKSKNLSLYRTIQLLVFITT